MATRPRAYLPPASTPDVPFGAAVIGAMDVVLSRRSAPGRVPVNRFGVRCHRPPVPVPAVPDDRSVRSRYPSGDLAGRESCMRPDRHFEGTITHLSAT